jgi:hypothetical protein
LKKFKFSSLAEETLGLFSENEKERDRTGREGRRKKGGEKGRSYQLNPTYCMLCLLVSSRLVSSFGPPRSSHIPLIATPIEHVMK